MTTEAARRTPARDRLLAAAERVFYAEGVHSVGVERVIAEAGVTRATFYHHFRSKDDLVQAYLAARSARIRQRTAAAAGAGDPGAAVQALLDVVGEEMCTPGFRGCAFVNAAVEYPDPDHPVARTVAEHRAWLREAVAGVLAGTGHPDPQRAAHAVTMLRDGAMISGALEGPDAALAAFRAAVTGLLTGRQARSSSSTVNATPVDET